MLEEPVALPEGAHVRVTLEAEGEPAERVDICCDGRPWPTTPQEMQEWEEWFASTGPVFETEEEVAQFEATLKAMREQQKPFLEKRARMIDSLFQ